MLRLTQATIDDLPVVNHIIEAAISRWNLAERVKRLSLSSYLYSNLDLQQYTILLAKMNRDIVGIISYEQAENNDISLNKNILFIHGIYVAPDFQLQGVGTYLINAVEKITKKNKLSGILIKAHKEAVPFYIKNNFTPIQVTDIKRDYPDRYWKSIES